MNTKILQLDFTKMLNLEKRNSIQSKQASIEEVNHNQKGSAQRSRLRLSIIYMSQNMIKIERAGN